MIWLAAGAGGAGDAGGAQATTTIVSSGAGGAGGAGGAQSTTTIVGTQSTTPIPESTLGKVVLGLPRKTNM